MAVRASSATMARYVFLTVVVLLQLVIFAITALSELTKSSSVPMSLLLPSSSQVLKEKELPCVSSPEHPAKPKPPLPQSVNETATSHIRFSDELASAGQNLTDNDSPFCIVRFRPENSFEYLDISETQPGIYRVPYEAGEYRYNGTDEYLANIFNGSDHVPPYVRIECVATYILGFNFDGIEALQFFRIWSERTRIVTANGEEKLLHSIGAEVLLMPAATGLYKVYPMERPDRFNKEWFIYSERNRSPYLLGNGMTVLGSSTYHTTIVRCISTNDNVVIRLYQKTRNGGYTFIVDSTTRESTGDNPFYQITVGFIVFNSPRIQNEYRCQTGYPNDFVDILVNPPDDEQPNEDYMFQSLINNGRLRIHINQPDPIKPLFSYETSADPSAACIGPQGSKVNITKIDSNNFEGRELVNCVAKIGEPCGGSQHHRKYGYAFNNFAMISNLPKSGYLVCTSDDLISYMYYFQGISGRVYYNWRDAPIEEVLRLTIYVNEWPWGEYNESTTLPSGTRISAQMTATGDISLPFLLYAELKNGSRQFVEEGKYSPESYVYTHVQSSWKALTLESQYWDGAEKISVTKKINTEYRPCPTDGIQELFQCNDELCIERRLLCMTANQTCPDGTPVNCTGIPPKSCPPDSWKCPNGERCIPKLWLCDGDNDCGDLSDEDPQICATLRTPRIRHNDTEEHYTWENEFDLLCDVFPVRNRVKILPNFTWFEEGSENNLNSTEYLYNLQGTGNIVGEQGLLSIYRVTSITRNTKYTCVARNDYGEGRKTYLVKVPAPCDLTTDNSTAPEYPPQGQNYQCKTEGKHPDPFNCSIYHECVDFGRDKLVHFQFDCGPGTVYCKHKQVCGYAYECPCNRNFNYTS